MPCTVAQGQSHSASNIRSNSHPFHSKWVDPPIPEIQQFHYFTLKIQGQSHGWAQSWKSQSGCNIKSEVSTLPIIIFFVVVCPRCLLHHILSLIAYTFRDNQDFVFIIIAQFMRWKSFGLQSVSVCLYMTQSHYHHCANLSDDIELIKCLSDIFCRVCE